MNHDLTVRPQVALCILWWVMGATTRALRSMKAARLVGASRNQPGVLSGRPPMAQARVQGQPMVAHRGGQGNPSQVSA